MCWPISEEPTRCGWRGALFTLTSAGFGGVALVIWCDEWWARRHLRSSLPTSSTLSMACSCVRICRGIQHGSRRDCNYLTAAHMCNKRLRHLARATRQQHREWFCKVCLCA